MKNAILLLLLVAVAPALCAIKGTAAIEQERRELDDLVRRADSTELRKLSPRILRLAEDLRVAKGDAEARPYFEKGLEGNAWALNEQLTLAEILSREGKPEASRQITEMALRLGEDDAVLRRASKILDRPPPAAPAPFSAFAGAAPSLVLVPIEEMSLFTLQDLKAELAKRLGIEVAIAAVKLPPLQPDRSAKQQWIARTRAQVLQAAKERPAAGAQIKGMGFTLEQIEKDDAALVAMVRKVTELEQGASGLQALDTMLTQLESVQQFDAEKVTASLQNQVADRASRNLLVLGVTEHDLFGGTSNFLFGTGAVGKFIGVISAFRFRAEFNHEAPKRQRLIDRLTKQSLSTIGFMLGVPRCTTPECARAYPQSLAEHDQKPDTMCATCRKAVEAVLEKKLPTD